MAEEEYTEEFDEDIPVEDTDEYSDSMSENETDVSSTAEGDYGNDDASPWGATMAVNGTTYAVSLFWQPLADQDDPMSEIKETAENIMAGADLYCMRTGTSSQYGIGNTKDGHRPNLPAAAAALADKFADKSSSVAVFKVKEGWWFVAIRNDLILSEEDVLYLNEEDAKRSFYAMMAVPDWGRKIAPASWDVEGAEEVDLEDVLTEPGSSRLTRIGGKNQKMLIIAGAAVLLILIIGYKLISSMFTQTAPKIVRPIAPIKQVFVEEQKKEVVVEKPKPWEKLVAPVDVLSYCYSGVQQIRSMVIPGWTLQTISCSSSGMSAIWKMTWGNLGWVKRAFEEYGTGRNIDYIIDDSGTSVIATFPGEKLPTYSATPRHMIFEAKEDLTQIFQAIQKPITFSEEKNKTSIVEDKTGLGRGNSLKTDKTEFPRLLFSFSSDLNPSEWLSLFDLFSALELLVLTYDPANNIWKYEGQIYEPRKL